MGQVVAKLYTVVIGAHSDPSQHIFGSIQDAIDSVEPGSTIILSAGDHIGSNYEIDRGRIKDPNYGCIRMKSSLKFIGLQGARIISSIIGEVSDVVFDNVIFKNSDNKSIEFKDGKGYLFRNCEFQINIKGVKNSNIGDIRFGFRLVGGSALLQNCIFCVSAEDLEIFIVIGADGGSSYLSLQSPIIRVQYKDVCKLETYFFRGVKNSATIPYFEAFSSSIHYRTEVFRETNYDGHCCLREKDRRRCGKRHCGQCTNDSPRRCKQSHTCCDDKCKRGKFEPINARIFRGLDCVNASLNSTKIYFIEGKGALNIAAGDAPIYMNALTASANVGNDWEVGDFCNILLTSFQSNLKCACEIKECHCITDCPKEKDCDHSSSESSSDDDHNCKHNKPCACPQQPFPCPQQPCVMNICPPCPLPPIPEPLPIPTPCGANPCPPCPPIPIPPNCPPKWIRCRDDCKSKHKSKSKQHDSSIYDDSARDY